MVLLDNVEYKTNGLSQKTLVLGVEVLLNHSTSDNISDRLYSYSTCEPYYMHTANLIVTSRVQKNLLSTLDQEVTYIDSFGIQEQVIIQQPIRIDRVGVERYNITMEMRSA